MGASDWREVAEEYANKFPEVFKEAERIKQAEIELMEFLTSDDCKVAKSLLRIGIQKIDLGVLYEDRETHKTERYFLGRHGLSYLLASEIDCFEATARDAVIAFYRIPAHRKLKISMVDWIKEQLDIMASQMLREASK